MVTRKILDFLTIPAVYLPKSIISFGVRCLGLFWDTIDRIQGQDFESLPPLHIRIQANANIRLLSYKKYGEMLLNYFTLTCRLKRNGTVLDVGSGSGIAAAPLTKYFDKAGKYEGFDINKELIDWCQQTITSHYSNFHFQFVDIYNGKYNPNGKIYPTKFAFPYKSNFFDIVVLSSVFTHMLPNDIEHYLNEIVRVLKKDGKCIISYILFDPVVDNLMKKKASSVDFRYTFGNYRTINIPKNNATYEDIVAYDVRYIRNIYQHKGLRINVPIHYGYWSGKRNTSSLHKQDIIIATKL